MLEARDEKVKKNNITIQIVIFLEIRANYQILCVEELSFNSRDSFFFPKQRIILAIPTFFFIFY